MKNIKFDFDDILIEAKPLTDIRSRDEINPFYSDGFLPIITAPMDTVVSSKNGDKFINNKILTCFPRNVQSDCFGFESYSLETFEDLYNKHLLERGGKYLIDIANGHMEPLYHLVKKTKKRYPNLVLMVGNVAHPEAYRNLSEVGADYIRVGIGNGNACTTTANTGVGYPMASLIKECYSVSLELDNPAKIVADGGMKTYSDIIKSLALGADYVMIGSIFNKSLESVGDNYLWGKFKISSDLAKKLYKHNFRIYKKFRGMSTKEVQRKWGKTKLRTSEGVIKYQLVEYRLSEWVENFTDYLKTAMSYCGAKNLNEFIGEVNINKITNNAYKRFNK